MRQKNPRKEIVGALQNITLIFNNGMEATYVGQARFTERIMKRKDLRVVDIQFTEPYFLPDGFERKADGEATTNND